MLGAQQDKQILVTTCLNKMLCRRRVTEVKTNRGRNLPVLIDRCGIRKGNETIRRERHKPQKLAIKNNGCKLEKFGCDMQVLNKKANSKRGRV